MCLNRIGQYKNVKLLYSRFYFIINFSYMYYNSFTNFNSIYRIFLRYNVEILLSEKYR